MAMQCILAACQSIQTTLTGGPDAAKTVGSIASDVCRAWKADDVFQPGHAGNTAQQSGERCVPRQLLRQRKARRSGLP